jgi:hypothetical protein
MYSIVGHETVTAKSATTRIPYLQGNAFGTGTLASGRRMRPGHNTAVLCQMAELPADLGRREFRPARRSDRRSGPCSPDWDPQ